MQFQDDGLLSFLEVSGSRLKKISFTRSTKSDKLLNALCVSWSSFVEIDSEFNTMLC